MKACRVRCCLTKNKQVCTQETAVIIKFTYLTMRATKTPILNNAIQNPQQCTMRDKNWRDAGEVD